MTLVFAIIDAFVEFVLSFFFRKALAKEDTTTAETQALHWPETRRVGRRPARSCGVVRPIAEFRSNFG